MGGTEISEQRFGFIRQIQQRLTTVVGRDAAADEAKRFKPIDEPACAVWLQNKPRRDIADRRCARGRGPDREQCLMLLRGEAKRGSPAFTEGQELTQRVAEIREHRIIRIAKHALGHDRFFLH